jgi:hypothetical protein
MTRTNQPLYARVLRLRHLAPSGLLCFVFLEGAVVLGILLALAELVSWWGVVVLPVTVALMVKFNDLVAGAFAPQAVATEGVSSRTAVLRPAVMATPSEQVAATRVMRPVGAATERGSGFGPAGAAFTRATGGSAPAAEWTGVYGTASGERAGGVYGSASGGRPGVYGPGSTGNHRPFFPADEQEPGFTPAAAPVAGGFTPAAMPLAGGYAPIVSAEPGPLGYDPAVPGDVMPEAPAVGYPGSYSRGVSGGGYLSGAGGHGSSGPGGHSSSSPGSGSPGPGVGSSGPETYGSSGSGGRGSPGPGGYSSSGAGGYGEEGQHQVRSTVEPAVEEPRAHNAPVRRAWADELDIRQQMARQAASRRYE